MTKSLDEVLTTDTLCRPVDYNAASLTEKERIFTVRLKKNAYGYDIYGLHDDLS